MRDACIDILREASFVQREDLERSVILRMGLVKLIEIIGEAAYKISAEKKEMHPEIPWKQIEGIRHRLVHDYYAININIVWNTITKEIQPLLEKVRHILDLENAAPPEQKEP
jgi:uncharacterized protein with HEPN domain